MAGRRRHGFAAFSSHVYPAPADFADAKVMPDGAYFDPKLGEFLLLYEVLRQSVDPRVALTAVMESTNLVAADLGHWDRMALDCPSGVPADRDHLAKWPNGAPTSSRTDWSPCRSDPVVSVRKTRRRLFEGYSGLDLLASSSSHFDPLATCRIVYF
ncbi:DUF5996 family protein [Bradyrhizobium sp. F1.13.3]|uniref:DUF5996 family protein n=1 Tax=Bradyrhizobium sp. F1.13.3 TaxID=3156351 RepID=UPI003395EDC0